MPRSNLKIWQSQYLSLTTLKMKVPLQCLSLYPILDRVFFLSNTVHAFNKVRTCMAVPSFSRLTFHLIDKVSVKFVVITWSISIHFRSSHQRCSVRQDILRNFAKFKGKHMCYFLFLIKLHPSGLQLY